MKHRGFCVLFLGIAFAAHAQTVLVYVDDRIDGLSGPGRTAVRNGIHDALFEAGYVFFDPGTRVMSDVDWSTGVSPDLRDAAIDGGADVLLVARAETVTARRDGGRPRVDTQVRVYVLRLRGYTLTSVAATQLQSSNQGREDTVDTDALGKETGAQVARMLDQALAASGAR